MKSPCIKNTVFFDPVTEADLLSIVMASKCKHYITLCYIIIRFKQIFFLFQSTLQTNNVLQFSLSSIIAQNSIEKFRFNCLIEIN